MQGLHLTNDLSGCVQPSALMTDPAVLRQLCLAAVAEVGLQAVGALFHRFTPQPCQDSETVGVTGVVLLAESHLAVHTWPEQAAVTLDVYVCNLGQDNGAPARALMRRLTLAFQASAENPQALQRGRLGELPGHTVTRL